MAYSQNAEDEIIAEYFGDYKGILLDIGANDGITFSNSRLLIEKGWKAMLIEPSLAYNKLSELYGEDNDTVAISEVAMSNRDGHVIFYELEDSLLSTTNKEMADSWDVPYTERSVVMLNAANYKEAHSRYDFISIDAEGEDWNILQEIDLTNTKCLCIECGNVPHLPALYTDYCSKYGMKLLHKNGENMIFTR